jgi:hypothetical protein
VRWTRYAGWLNVVLGVALGIGMAAAGLAPVGGILLVSLVVTGLFMVWLGAGWDRPLEDESDLHRYGRPANAKVLAVEDARLDGRGGRSARMKLHVAPVNESDYRVTRRLSLPGGRVPAVGETVTVKFDPQRRKSLVLLEESFLVEDHATRARKMFEAGGLAPTAPPGPRPG